MDYAHGLLQVHQTNTIVDWKPYLPRGVEDIPFTNLLIIGQLTKSDLNYENFNF